MQALADAEHGVIAEALRFLTAVCRDRLIRKPSVLAAARKVGPHQHPCFSAPPICFRLGCGARFVRDKKK